MNNIIFIVKSNIDNTAMAKASYMPPLGLLSIANHLKLHGYNVKVLDFSTHYYDTQEIDEMIDDLNPLYVAFSVYTENVDSIFSICRYLKKKFKNLPLVLGGPHPTLDIDYCKRKRFVDFILTGDGEHSALELALAIKTNEELIHYNDIQGIVYKDKQGHFRNGAPKRLVANMDLLPIINRDFIPTSFDVQLPTIYSSRGCPGKCIYCAAASMSGSKYRVRNIENVFVESLYIVDQCKGYNQIFYCDDTFTVFRDRLEKFIELYKVSSVKFRWRCESRVDALYRYKDLLSQLKTAGCHRIQFGIESGNQEVLNKIRKGLVLEHAYDIIDETIKAGIRVVASFIFGHYCDTLETMNDTLNMMIKLKKKYGSMFETTYGLNTPFPGTYQYDHMEELGMELLSNQFSDLDMVGPAIRTENFSEEDLLEFNKKAAQLYKW